MRIRHDLPPILDYHKAKELLWEPRKISLHQDKKDWISINEAQREAIL